MGRVETLASAKKKLHDAEDRFERFLAKRFPIGSELRWKRGEHVQCGEVIATGRESVKVRNLYTGKAYWVDSYFIIDRKVSPHAG